MNTVLEDLKVRGFYAQCTNPEGLSALMDREPVTFYVGCDPTGTSLHIGHMVPYFAYRHLQEAGHRGIALIGGGTARIGDPSGKTETRKMLSYEQLDYNAQRIYAQLDRFIGFNGNSTVSANNKDWLSDLNYIDFLRDIGSHFSVNRMLRFEAYRARLETGLSFIEFNYQLLQSYDFLELYRRYGCLLQIGVDDQWGNIVAGTELVRRIEGIEVFGMTFPLILTAEGKKMGKTEKGSVFLDPEMTSVYEFFQYWRNVSDADIQRFLLMFTFLSVEECRALTAPGTNPNEAKERLAWEVCALIHGKEEADTAMAGARAAFGGDGGDRSAMPTVKLQRAQFEQGYPMADLFFDAGLSATKSEARRLIQQGGAFFSKSAAPLQNSMTEEAALEATLQAASSLEEKIYLNALNDAGELILRAGKKRYCRVTLSE